MFCKECGNEVNDNADMCVKCGCSVKKGGSGAPKSRAIYIVLAFFLGGMGIHNFYAGHTNKAVIQLLCCFLGWILLFIPNLIVLIWVLIECFTVKEDGNGNAFE